MQPLRARIGSSRVLGVTVEDADQARAAEGLGADYVAATVWPTATKPEAKPVGIEAVRRIAHATRLPLVGIGGINATNAADVLEAGCAGVAVVSAVGAAVDPVSATRALVEAVRTARTERQRG